MNVTFRLPTEELETKFVKESTAAGLDGLKGHRSVGGMRASIYNAFPEDGVDALVSVHAGVRAPERSRSATKIRQTILIIALREPAVLRWPAYQEGSSCSCRSYLPHRLGRRHPGRRAQHDDLPAPYGDAQGPRAQPGGGVHVQVRPVADDGPLDEGVGGRAPEASRVHRRGRRSAQPEAPGLLEGAARQRLLLHPRGEEDRRHRALRAGHRRGLVGSRGVQARPRSA